MRKRARRLARKKLLLRLAILALSPRHSQIAADLPTRLPTREFPLAGQQILGESDPFSCTPRQSTPSRGMRLKFLCNAKLSLRARPRNWPVVQVCCLVTRSNLLATRLICSYWILAAAAATADTAWSLLER